MNILFYTRLEKNTGGDETFLFITLKSLLDGLDPQGGPHNICLVIKHDSVSLDRAETIKNEKWKNAIEDKLGAGAASNSIVWLNHQNDPPKAMISKGINCPNISPSDWLDLQNFIVNPPLDLFVIAGWAHQLTSRQDINHMRNTLKISNDTKILLCVTPGQEIKSELITSMVKNWKNVYCLQPGVEAGQVGFFTAAAEDIILDDTSRAGWVGALRDHSHIPEDTLNTSLGNGDNQKDKFIVIYCSKDSPNKFNGGLAFIQKLNARHDKDELSVILIGADDTNLAVWKKPLYLGHHFKDRIYSMQRTSSTAILMQGLKDATCSMTTGTFSVLEAIRLNIKCDYLFPAHLVDFKRAIESLNSQDDPKQWFFLGEQALIEIGKIITQPYTPRLLSHNQDDRITAITEELQQQQPSFSP